VPKQKATVPFTLVEGEPRFEINDADWLGIESAYGHKLSESVRSAIGIATWRYLLFAQSEKAASPLSDARKRIRIIANAAKAFRSLLIEHHRPQSDSSIFADHVVTKHLGGGQLSDEAHRLSSIEAACDSAERELKDPHHPSHRQGEAWDHWICELTSLLTTARLPTVAGKNVDGLGGHGAELPFPTLVLELERHLPAGCPRHTQSSAALVQAIHRARRGLGAGGHKR
jgi:hypothetical protein